MRGTVTEWKKILTTTLNLIHLSDMCQSLPQHVDLFQKLSHCQSIGDLHRISNIIHRLINLEESRRAGRCVVNHGVDDDLDQCTAFLIDSKLIAQASLVVSGTASHQCGPGSNPTAKIKFFFQRATLH